MKGSSKHEAYCIVNGEVARCDSAVGERYYVRKDGVGVEEVFFVPSTECANYGAQARLIKPRILTNGRRDFSDFFEDFPGLEKVVEHANKERQPSRGNFQYEASEKYHDETIILDLPPVTPDKPLRAVAKE